MSTIVMRVDLDCEKCYKKIRKVLCKIQDKVSIRTITYDEKSKTVSISGPFDAEEVADRLTSNAGKVITDIHVAGGGGNQKHVFNAPTKTVKADGHGHGGYGGGKPEKGHGGFSGGGGGDKKQEKGLFGFGGGKQEKGHGHGGHGGGKQEKGHGHGGFGGGGKQDKGHGGGGGKPEKKQVKFDFDDMSDDDDDDFFDDGPAHGHGNHGAGGHGGKPKIVHTTTPVAARLDAPRTGPSMSMAAAAPMRMMPPAGMMAPHHHHHQQQPQAMAVPSIWPAPAAAPEWGYSAPQQYGGYPAGGGYYGGVPAAAYGYGAPAYGYGRNPYGQPQYYEEEPSAGCSVM
ncbi:hypothetical protein PR202_gb20194 [Eleusine coracana subsp. coracana]|uniref:HMA domain-containing protein n=1 Tax=Eleusine coracana subsp. coracana TaxID=191504 RepID=A0AAV5F9N3_ELECO|nr:hypothetical protein QOZ80_3BG0275990 [Eleusine coracana subsp. coracana]GJN31757.1 hypothetical protein PR202_gb20194 [Eleusine coracana subsp. coracana]